MRAASCSRILVAVDGRQPASFAASEAVRLAARLQAKVHFVHVLDDFPLTAAKRAAGAEILAHARRMAEDAGVAADTKLLERGESADVAKALVAEAQAWHANLLVFGTHARRGLERVMLGSVSEAVAHAACIPLMLVPETWITAAPSDR